MCLPLISQMTQMNPKRRNNNNHKTNLATISLSLRNNAACCIPLRDLRNLRENNTQEYPSYIAQTKPQYLPQISLIYADKTTITIPDETHIFL